MNTLGRVDSKRVRRIFFAFRRHFHVSVDYKGVASEKTHKHRPQRTGTNGARENHCQLARAPQYLKDIVHEELSKVNDDFRKGTRRGGRGCKTKKMRDLLMPPKNLTNMHSTCILRFELGLEREN